MIPFPLAQAMTDADFSWHFWQMVLTIGPSVINMVVLLWGLNHMAKMKVGPQPFRIELEKEFATKEELRLQRAEQDRDQAKLEQRMTRLEHKLDQDKSEIIKSGSDRGALIYGRIEAMRDDFHNRIDTVLKAVSRVEGAIEQERTHRS